MSDGLSVAPEGFPQHPTRVIVNGVPPGPAADQAIDFYRAQLNRFHAAQQQNVRNGGEASAVYRVFRDLGGAGATYVNHFGQESLILDVHPQEPRERPERPPEPDYWKWALVELEITNMVGFQASFNLEPQVGGVTVREADNDIELPNGQEPPEVEDSSRTVSLLIDLQNVGGQEVEFILTGSVLPRDVIGGTGSFQNQTGTCTLSEYYGQQSISRTRDGKAAAITAPKFSPSDLVTAPLLNNIATSQGGDPEGAIEKLAYTFPVWSGVTDYVVLPFESDHRQDIIWLRNVMWVDAGGDIIDNTDTRYAFWNPHGPATGGDHPDGGQLVGPYNFLHANPNDYNVLPYWDPSKPVTEYWDAEQLHKKTITAVYYIGSYAPDGSGSPTWQVPAPGGVGGDTGQYYRGTDFYVPTWRYEEPRTAQLRAVCAKVNNWTMQSKRRKEGETLPGEDDPVYVESYRWETAAYPQRPTMKIIDAAVPVEATGEEPPVIGRLKIDTNSGKVTFIAG